MDVALPGEPQRYPYKLYELAKLLNASPSFLKSSMMLSLIPQQHENQLLLLAGPNGKFIAQMLRAQYESSKVLP
jgi:hypothetical protein